MTLSREKLQTAGNADGESRISQIRVHLYSSCELHHAAFRYLLSPERHFLLEYIDHELPRNRDSWRLSQPDLAIVDLTLLIAGQPESLAETLSSLCSLTSVVLLAEQIDIGLLRQVIACGINGYLLTSLSLEVFLQALQVVAQGGFWLGQYISDAHAATCGQAVSARTLSYDDADYIVRSLSLRERQILHCTAVGKTSKEIASQLYLSESSVRTYWYRVLSKLNALNKAEAIARAARLGLLEREIANGAEMKI